MPSEPRFRRLGLVAIAAIVVLSAGIWVYALFLSDAKPVDTLRDATFPRTAQPICADAVTRLRAAGVVDVLASSPQQRADLASRADAVVADMVAELRGHVPTTGDDARIVSTWLDDWGAWLEDRATWEASLRAGKDGPFNERQRQTGEPNSQALDKLADTNAMPACKIPQGI